ncbi:DUF3141 domain-containing protein [Niveibacterium sp. 24ML]|uniref:DUF3141 domain-containing protein n=1 Tax=Niveibacterium sp. 24ML TaxID=2985512 RepID=UPI00226E7434|nr:DUF3141 domain-containing protein [Niveibacterium sp. 24ML]MCX9158495.1 DUF3141 domain-containing protein [Niveibacterium sp. 24ML]
MDTSSAIAHYPHISAKVASLFDRCSEIAHENFATRLSEESERQLAAQTASVVIPFEFISDWARYTVDAGQRALLFWDSLRQHSNNDLEHLDKGQTSVLYFDYEMVLDGRRSEKPANDALLCILATEGLAIDPEQRPHLIIDPRAGRGFGGFKNHSPAGVPLCGGYPVYFVLFFREPERGLALLDVCAAEQGFVRRVRELHPDSPKPAIIGNCQGGRTPMSYGGGMPGGRWLASLVADQGNGVFDARYLVENFVNLHPANANWNMHRHVYVNADNETPRFLEFERRRGGFYLLKRQETSWITHNLFVGNALWKGQTCSRAGKTFDPFDIESPIVLFASMGDNITPPQAFNWVPDTYGSIEEIKARGQVIVGLLHLDIDQLGIFVTGKVVQKEHIQIVEELDSIELLPPGLNGMTTKEAPGSDSATEYEVTFHDVRHKDIVAHPNQLERTYEKPFEAVAQVSDLNQRAYVLFDRPPAQSITSDFSAKLMRAMHPLRMQRRALSDRNPWLSWLPTAAAAAKAWRQPLAADSSPRQCEQYFAEEVSTSLDSYRATHDATSEAMSIQTYGGLFALHDEAAPAISVVDTEDARRRAFVQDALESISEGGYDEAFARMMVPLIRKGDLPLSWLVMQPSWGVPEIASSSDPAASSSQRSRLQRPFRSPVHHTAKRGRLRARSTHSAEPEDTRCKGSPEVAKPRSLRTGGRSRSGTCGQSP